MPLLDRNGQRPDLFTRDDPAAPAIIVPLADLDAVLDAYRDRLATLGRRVRVEQPGGASLVGVATAVTDNGALVVGDDTGTEHIVTAADVVHLRPA